MARSSPLGHSMKNQNVKPSLVNSLHSVWTIDEASLLAALWIVLSLQIKCNLSTFKLMLGTHGLRRQSRIYRSLCLFEWYELEWHDFNCLAGEDMSVFGWVLYRSFFVQFNRIEVDLGFYIRIRKDANKTRRLLCEIPHVDCVQAKLWVVYRRHSNHLLQVHV